MNKPILVEKLLDFAGIAPEWTLVKVCIDWHGDPVMLFDEGRPAFPTGFDEQDARQRWYQTKPTAHHVIRFRDGIIEQFHFANTTQASLTTFAQPLGQGWLLAEGRGGNGRVYDSNCHLIQTLNLGDAIQDLQTTKDGLIWVSYFDEGVYGGGIGANGLVCFDSNGAPKFFYADLASSSGFPHIDDCYALNVSEDEVWLSYYSDFPLVCLKNFKVAHRLEPEASFHSFAMRGQDLLFVPAYSGNSISIIHLASGIRKEFDPIDPDGSPLKNFQNSSYKYFASDPERFKHYKPFAAIGRTSKLYLFTEKSLYLVP